VWGRTCSQILRISRQTDSAKAIFFVESFAEISYVSLCVKQEYALAFVSASFCNANSINAGAPLTLHIPV